MAKKNPSAEVAATPVARRIEYETSDAVPTFYANNAAVDISTFDAKIRLGVIQGVAADVVTVRDVAHIYMSHEHFRAYVGALSNLLARMDKRALGKPDTESVQ